MDVTTPKNAQNAQCRICSFATEIIEIKGSLKIAFLHFLCKVQPGGLENGINLGIERFRAKI